MLPLLRCCCCCCCCALRKEIYVHYRLFLSDDVNFVAFLAFAACGMRQRQRQSERQRETTERHSTAPCSPWLCAARCTLHIGYRCIERKLKIFSWRCLSCLINVVLDCCCSCCCCCSCWCIAWQHLICCAHALATLLPVLVPQSIANVANTQRNSGLHWECIYKATEKYFSI